MTDARELNEPRHREMARQMRDEHWEFADRVNRQGTVWVCWWNKNRHHDESKPLPDDLLVHGLITGMELLEWLGAHKDWWTIGEWSDERYAAPVSLTDAGREALANRHLYDMEPVTGGLVEPGWQTIPTPAQPDHLANHHKANDMVGPNPDSLRASASTTRTDDNDAYRRDMIDAGRGHLLR